MSHIVLTAENFDETINAGKTVLVDFWAAWCGPCRMLSPVIDEIGEEFPDVVVGKVNVDEVPDLAFRFEIASIPTILVFKDGQPVAKSVGVAPKDDITALL